MLYLSLSRCSAWAVACLLLGADVVAATLSPPVLSLSQLPLQFEANTGQTDPEARFLARGHGFTIYLSGREAVLALSRSERAEPENGNAIGHANRKRAASRKSIQYNLRLGLPGANPQAEVSGLEALGGRVSYFIGNDPGQWHSGVETFGRVLYRGIYPGIDLVFYGNAGQLEYDFNLAPGADPALIGFKFTGADNLALTDAGALIVEIAGGQLRWRAPVAYQDVNGTRVPVAAAFTIPAPDRIGFTLGDYDHQLPLVIDPLLDYSTFLGGSGLDDGLAIRTDRGGNVFVTGQTDSLNFPTNRAFWGTNFGGTEVFVTRLNTNATALLYSTYVGGGGTNTAYGIAVDSAGNAYVAGVTGSGNFPTRNAVQPALNGASDAFLFKLGTNGTNLIYSTYFGGSGDESAFGVAVDAGVNNAYICGETTSSMKNQFPSNPSNLQSMYGGLKDAFVARFNTAGAGASSLTWWSWLGGRDVDVARAIAVDSTNAIYVTGEVDSCNAEDGCTPNFPIKNALQPNYGGSDADAFVVKILGDGSASVWSTYLGGTNEDMGYGIALDSANNVYVVGSTSSTNFPIVNAFQDSNAGEADFFVTLDGFLVKIRANGSGLDYSTYFGGIIDEEAYGVAVDLIGNAWVVGRSTSPDLPVKNTPLQADFGGGADAFVALFNPSLSGTNSLVFSTYFGGASYEIGNGIAVDTNSNCYIVGTTSGTNLSGVLPGVVQPVFGGGFTDAFVSKIALPPLLQLARSGTNHLASWPNYPSGYAVVSRTNASSGSWSNVPGTVTLSNGINRLVVTNSGSRKFLKLRKP